MKYGIPYMGSKRGIAKGIVDYILCYNPHCKYVYDLFGGGGAITFEFLKRNQIKKVFYNELNTGVCELLKKIRDDGVTEEFYQFIDRETFNKHKDDNDWFGGFIKTCWSFGNNQTAYLYGKTVEEIKRQGHLYCENKQLDGFPYCASTEREKRRLFLNQYAKNEFNKLIVGNEKDFKKYIEIVEKKHTKETMFLFTNWLRTTGITAKEITEITGFSDMAGHYLSIKSQPAIPTLEAWDKIKIHPKIKDIPQWIKNLFSVDEVYKKEKLANLEHLEHLQTLNIINLSYEEVKIEAPSEETIIYLDPPYENTAGYQCSINHNELWEYVKKSPYKIYVSSYESPLELKHSLKHTSKLSQGGNDKKVTENLYCNR